MRLTPQNSFQNLVLLNERTSTILGNERFRYGFQNQEMDDEVKGDGNSVNYQYRMHDTRLGRFFAIDPLAGKYPFYSPYAFSGNRVIDAIELEGLEPVVMNDGVLAGYIVQKGQGYYQIAKDINNTETQKKYGYSLTRKVSWKEIKVYSKLDHVLQPKDILVLQKLEVEQKTESAIVYNNRQIKYFRKKIESLEANITSNRQRMYELDQYAQNKIQENKGPDQGDPGGAKDMQDAATNIEITPEYFGLQIENKKLREKINEYKDDIYVRKETVKNLKISLKNSRKEAEKINSKKDE
jgi:RHS repeat-associated protein